MSPYPRFAQMIATSTVVMYSLMYLNTYRASDVYFSETRAYMALIMGASMAILMLLFMRDMYTHRRANIVILAGSGGILLLALWLVRSQATVDDVSWMKAMIPHHSIALLTSSRARIEDPQVRRLADAIIASQQREILEMQQLLAELEDRR